MPLSVASRQEVLDFCDKTVGDAVIHGQFNYSEQPNRWDWAQRTDATLFSAPIFTDCSGYATMGDWQTTPQVPDPSGVGYTPGYTGTLLAHLPPILDPADVRPADFVVFGPHTGDHVAIVRDTTTADFRCASHGQQGDPSWATVSVMAASISPTIRYLRNDVSQGPPPLTKGSPAWQLAQQGYHAPMGAPPTLVLRSTHGEWDVLARRVLRLYGEYRGWLAPPAGWGARSHNALVRWQRTWNANPLHRRQQFAPDGKVSTRIWAAWGFTW